MAEWELLDPKRNPDRKLMTFLGMYLDLWPPSELGPANSNEQKQNIKTYEVWVKDQYQRSKGYWQIPYFQAFPPDNVRLKYPYCTDENFPGYFGMMQTELPDRLNHLDEFQFVYYINLFTRPISEVVYQNQSKINYLSTQQLEPKYKHIVLFHHINDMRKISLQISGEEYSGIIQLMRNYPEIFKATRNGTEIPYPFKTLPERPNPGQNTFLPDPIEIIRFLPLLPERIPIAEDHVFKYSPLIIEYQGLYQQLYADLFDPYFRIYIGQPQPEDKEKIQQFGLGPGDPKVMLALDKWFRATVNEPFQELIMEKLKLDYLGTPDHLGPVRKRYDLYSEWVTFVQWNFFIIFYKQYLLNPGISILGEPNAHNLPLIRSKIPTDESAYLFLSTNPSKEAEYCVKNFDTLPTMIQAALDINTAGSQTKSLAERLPLVPLSSIGKMSQFLLFWDFNILNQKDFIKDPYIAYPQTYGIKNIFEYVEMMDKDKSAFGSSRFRAMLQHFKVDLIDRDAILFLTRIYVSQLRLEVHNLLISLDIEETMLVSRSNVAVQTDYSKKIRQWEIKLGRFKYHSLDPILNQLRAKWEKTGEWSFTGKLFEKKEEIVDIDRDKLTKEEKDFLDFMEQYPLNDIKDPGLVGAIRHKLNPGDYDLIVNAQWRSYLIWVQANIEASGKKGYRRPGTDMVTEDNTEITFMVKDKMKNSCFDFGILKTDENKRKWWFYQPLGFGWTVTADFLLGSDFWIWVGSAAARLFLGLLDVLKQIGQFLLDVAENFWDKFKWPILIGVAVLATGVIGFQLTEEELNRRLAARNK